jgi:hypothetical protein
LSGPARRAYDRGVSLTSILLAAITLPPTVGSPGGGNVALGAGVDGTAPAAEVRWGVAPFLAVGVEGAWHPRAPLVGGRVRLAAGDSHRFLFADAWAEGHLRPVVTSDITQSLAGSDVAAGLGLVALWRAFSVGIDGGVALGIPVVEVQLDDVDRDAIDQQGGLFGVQRLTLAFDLGDHVELAARGAFAVPIDSVHFDRRERDVLGRWDVQLGGRLFVRF